MSSRHGRLIFFFVAPLLWTTCPATQPADVEERVLELRHQWDDDELPLELLTIDPGRKPAGRISREQAAKDVERLFYLFSRGYSGYAFFNADASFERAKERILDELAAQGEWRADDFAALLREQLRFVRDCHTRVGGIPYGSHLDFWYDTDLDLIRIDDEYRCTIDGTEYVATAIEGQSPKSYLKPSLSERGESVFRIGVLSASKPEPLALSLVGDRGSRTIEVELRRSDFTFYSKKIFREDRIAGIPVLRLRSFSEHHSDDIERFLETADRYRGEACVIVDIRGNGGGSESFVVEWIQRLTGERANSIFIFSELNSRTTMIGRANYMAYLHHFYPKTDLYGQEAARYTQWASEIGPDGAAPFWTGPIYPDNPTIPNETTIIVITNGLVASAAEGFVMRVSQAENVVIVGENTRGALTFGNVSAHRLPNSGLMVNLPINLNLFSDLVFREERGLFPHYWVPAADALNRAVAALRRGTIATARPLPPDWLAQEFVPENKSHRAVETILRRLVVVGLLALGGIVWAFLLRRKPALLIGLGAAWLVVGAVWINIGARKAPGIQDAGFGFLAIGVIGIICGLVLRARAGRRAGQVSRPA